VTLTANEANRSGKPARKPLIIGLTGGIGSGKSTVAGLFSSRGVPVLDADQLTRQLVRPGEPALAAITALFGNDCLQQDGTLDRAWMRRKIFSDPASKQQLEAILHPAVRQCMEAWVGAVQSPFCILVIPLLLETGQSELVDRVVVVDIPEKEQLKRVAARDSLSHNAIHVIMDSQADRKTRLAAADDIIDNDTDPDTLQQRVADLHRQFLEITHEHQLDDTVR
jgi:dephospho-CoA kinase